MTRHADPKAEHARHMFMLTKQKILRAKTYTDYVTATQEQDQRRNEYLAILDQHTQEAKERKKN